MELTNSQERLSEKIGQEILKAWKLGHGGNAKKVHLFQGEDGLAILIPQALYQAELDLYSNSPGGGQVLNKYLRTLLQTVALDFIPMAEEMVGNAISEVVPLIDLKAGWATIFFRSKEITPKKGNQ